MAFNSYQNINTNPIQQNIQNQVYTDYPEVFFTQKHKQENINSNMQNNPQQKGLISNLGISKDMLGQFLPLLFGKGGNSNNILTSLLQSNIMQNGKNNMFSKLFNGNNDISQIFSTLNSNNKNTSEKKDTSNIIDMSDYIEIK